MITLDLITYIGSLFLAFSVGATLTIVNLPEEREEGVDVTHLIGIHHLTNTTCRWPVSGAGVSTMFCGDLIHEGSRYCSRHHRRAYIKV